MSRAAGPSQSLIQLGKAWRYPLMRVVCCRGEVITKHGTRALEWELACGHTMIVPRYKEKEKHCVRRRCKRCPLIR